MHMRPGQSDPGDSPPGPTIILSAAGLSHLHPHLSRRGTFGPEACHMTGTQANNMEDILRRSCLMFKYGVSELNPFLLLMPRRSTLRH